MLERRVKKAIACDISSKSLEKAVQLSKLYGLDDIEFRCGDGLQPLDDNEVDCAVIAGMGGKEIIAILSEIPQGIKKFVLVAHKNTIELRKFLADKNLYIDKDFVVEESGKFYNIIVSLADSEKDCRLSEKELFLGKNGDCNPDYQSYILKLRQKKSALEEFADKSREAKILNKIFEIIDERQ